MAVRFWDLMQWTALPLFRLGWHQPMGYASTRYCRAIARAAHARVSDHE
jgi:hypothetical protein